MLTILRPVASLLVVFVSFVVSILWQALKVARRKLRERYDIDYLAYLAVFR